MNLSIRLFIFITCKIKKRERFYLCGLLHSPFAFEQARRAIDWKREKREARGTMGIRQTKREVLSRFLVPCFLYALICVLREVSRYEAG